MCVFQLRGVVSHAPMVHLDEEKLQAQADYVPGHK